MTIAITSRFGFTLDEPATALLQFEAAALPDQIVTHSACSITPAEELSRIPAQDGIGERVWLQGNGTVEVEYEAQVAAHREEPALDRLAAAPLHLLPGEAVQYLLDSRYCRADDFQSLVASEFAGTQGGARIAAIEEWIGANFSYVPGASDTSTSATESFVKRQGVCRDYAHVLVTLARASSIPARYVACYAPGVTPQDFHAVAQVYLSNADATGGAWHLVDPTGMADLGNAAIIGVGRDAADVSFITSFGPMRFEHSSVEVALSN